MTKGNLFFISGLIGFGGLAFGAWKKILHQPNADIALTIGFIAFAIFYVMTVWDLLQQPYPNRATKILWVLLVLGFPAIGALIYHALKNNKQVTN